MKNEKPSQKEIKNELFIDFSRIGGSHKNFDKAKALKRKIEKYFKDTSIADHQLLDVLKLLNVYENSNDYEEFEKNSQLVSSIEERLKYTDIANWDINDIRLSQATVAHIGNFEKANELVKKTLLALEEHIKDRPIDMIKLFLYLNLLSCFTKSAFFKVDITEDSEESTTLKKFVKICYNQVSEICDKNGEEFEVYKLMALIRISFFERNSAQTVEYLNKLKKTQEKELYKAMKQAVIQYSPKYGFDITEKQLNIMTGARIRELRKKLGLKLEEFAQKTNYSASHMGMIELGERAASTYLLVTICKTFNIPLDELVNGGSEGKKN